MKTTVQMLDDLAIGAFVAHHNHFVRLGSRSGPPRWEQLTGGEKNAWRAVVTNVLFLAQCRMQNAMEELESSGG